MLNGVKHLNAEILRYAQNDKGRCHGECGEKCDMKQYYVYIMTNASRTLYTGLTGDLERRVHEHKHKLVPGFTSKYNITRLVYYEVTSEVHAALEREKQIKGWLRAKKIALIESANPHWEDLSGVSKVETTGSS